jgi:hypothetical protein
MPRTRRKRSADNAKVEVSQIISPGGVEVLSLDVFDGKVTKRRAVERVSFAIPTSSDDTPVPPDDTPTSPDDALNAENIVPPRKKNKGPVRSPSVSILFCPELVSNFPPPASDA